jgi:hypothetical protein
MKNTEIRPFLVDGQNTKYKLELRTGFVFCVLSHLVCCGLDWTKSTEIGFQFCQIRICYVRNDKSETFFCHFPRFCPRQNTKP